MQNSCKVLFPHPKVPPRCLRAFRRVTFFLQIGEQLFTKNVIFVGSNFGTVFGTSFLGPWAPKVGHKILQMRFLCFSESHFGCHFASIFSTQNMSKNGTGNGFQKEWILTAPALKISALVLAPCVLSKNDRFANRSRKMC